MNQTKILTPMRNTLLLALVAMNLAASAQTITFETTDYKSLGEEVDYIYIQGDDETDRILVWNSTEG